MSAEPFVFIKVIWLCHVLKENCDVRFTEVYFLIYFMRFRELKSSKYDLLKLSRESSCLKPYVRLVQEVGAKW